MAAAPFPDVPEDPEDPRVILRNLPDREHELFLGQYREAVEAARDPAGFAELRRLLRDWSIRVIAVSRPGYYEAIEEAREAIRRGEPGVPAEDAIPGWNERLAAALAARA